MSHFCPIFCGILHNLSLKVFDLYWERRIWGGGEGFGVKKGGLGAGLVFGALHPILTNFELFSPDFLQDFIPMPIEKSLIAIGNGECGGKTSNFGQKMFISGHFLYVWGFARHFERVLPDFEPFLTNFLRDFTQPLSKSLWLLIGGVHLG